MPAGWIFGHKGSAVFPEEGTDELFLLGYLNSALATYFMKKIVNTTATADVGYLEKVPYRRPSPELESAVVERVERIVESLKANPAADIQSLRDEIDELIFDLFEIRTARDEIRRFYRTVGRVEAQEAAASE
jgi:beta-galactosidase/beta-glucuronidase